ncbi:[FeFe] hydrogenase H-cluster radical SAM maturase HydE [Acidaminococcus fermentans]|uniref:[FeFe] hydrogenase H-cluster radical SAM maturase HydE n=2 Tax=Acidaminococcus TaxID=904 RepID=UPI0024307FA0|nr:[FeFe] hydrogenase H-cluster radical SAM maturase HydE [Acidaminococcus fermentans]
MDIVDLVDKLKEYSVLTEEEYKELLLTEDPLLRAKLFRGAQEAMNFVFHRKVHFQGVLEFTNHCPQNCLFCRRREENNDLPRFRLNWEQIRGACELGYQMGIRSFLLQGGEDHYYTDMIMCNLLRNLQKQFPDCALGLSIGERSRQSYHRLHQAGAQRYFLSFQTSDPLHFSRLHPPTHSLSTKIACINDLKDLGFETDTGFLVGAPYEQAEYLVRDLTLLQELAPHSITLTPFLPEEGTPFYQQDRMALEEYLRLTAVLRILFPRANIVAPWSIRRIHAHGQILSVQSGANVLRMPMAPPAGPEDLSQDAQKKMLHTVEVMYRYLKNYGYYLTPGRGDSLLYPHRVEDPEPAALEEAKTEETENPETE